MKVKNDPSAANRALGRAPAWEDAAMPNRLEFIKSLGVVAAMLACILAGAPATAIAVCGDGVVDENEECDPGGDRYCNGDPAQGACTTGAQCPGSVNCYYAGSCCKFNCQFVGEGADCSDGNACTGPDKCNNVGECTGNAINGGSCDDGLFCTTGDTCEAGACVGDPFVPAECDDGDPCTDDGCDLAGGCTHTFNTAPCDDGALCTVADTCSQGVCSGTLGSRRRATTATNARTMHATPPSTVAPAHACTA